MVVHLSVHADHHRYESQQQKATNESQTDCVTMNQQQRMGSLTMCKNYSKSANRTLTTFTNEMSEILKQSIQRLDNISMKVRGCVYEIEKQRASRGDDFTLQKGEDVSQTSTTSETIKSTKAETRRKDVSNILKHEETIMHQIREQHKRHALQTTLTEAKLKIDEVDASQVEQQLEVLRDKYTNRPKRRVTKKAISSEPHVPRIVRAKQGQKINECYVNEKFSDSLWFGPKLTLTKSTSRNNSPTSTSQNNNSSTNNKLPIRRNTKLARKYANENFHDCSITERPLPNTNYSGARLLKINSDSKQDWNVIVHTQKSAPMRCELKQNSPFCTSTILDDITIKDLEPLKAEYPRRDNLIEFNNAADDDILYKLVNEDGNSLEYLVDVSPLTPSDTPVPKQRRFTRNIPHAIPAAIMEEGDTLPGGDNLTNYTKKTMTHPYTNKTVVAKPTRKLKRVSDVDVEHEMMNSMGQKSTSSKRSKRTISINDYQSYRKLTKKDAKRQLFKYIIDPTKIPKTNYIVMPALIEFDKPIQPHLKRENSRSSDDKEFLKPFIYDYTEITLPKTPLTPSAQLPIESVYAKRPKKERPAIGEPSKSHSSTRSTMMAACTSVHITQNSKALPLPSTTHLKSPLRRQSKMQLPPHLQQQTQCYLQNQLKAQNKLLSNHMRVRNQLVTQVKPEKLLLQKNQMPPPSGIAPSNHTLNQHRPAGGKLRISATSKLAKNQNDIKQVIETMESRFKHIINEKQVKNKTLLIDNIENGIQNIIEKLDNNSSGGGGGNETTTSTNSSRHLLNNDFQVTSQRLADIECGSFVVKTTRKQFGNQLTDDEKNTIGDMDVLRKTPKMKLTQSRSSERLSTSRKIFIPEKTSRTSASRYNPKQMNSIIQIKPPPIPAPHKQHAMKTNQKPQQQQQQQQRNSVAKNILNKWHALEHPSPLSIHDVIETIDEQLVEIKTPPTPQPRKQLHELPVKMAKETITVNTEHKMRIKTGKETTAVNTDCKLAEGTSTSHIDDDQNAEQIDKLSDLKSEFGKETQRFCDDLNEVIKLVEDAKQMNVPVKIANERIAVNAEHKMRNKTTKETTATNTDCNIPEGTSTSHIGDKNAEEIDEVSDLNSEFGDDVNEEIKQVEDAKQINVIKPVKIAKERIAVNTDHKMRHKTAKETTATNTDCEIPEGTSTSHIGDKNADQIDKVSDLKREFGKVRFCDDENEVIKQVEDAKQMNVDNASIVEEVIEEVEEEEEGNASSEEEVINKQVEDEKHMNLVKATRVEKVEKVEDDKHINVVNASPVEEEEVEEVEKVEVSPAALQSDNYLTPFMKAVKQYRKEREHPGFVEYMDRLANIRDVVTYQCATQSASVTYLAKEQYLVKTQQVATECTSCEVAPPVKQPQPKTHIVEPPDDNVIGQPYGRMFLQRIETQKPIVSSYTQPDKVYSAIVIDTPPQPKLLTKSVFVQNDDDIDEENVLNSIQGAMDQSGMNLRRIDYDKFLISVYGFMFIIVYCGLNMRYTCV